MKELIRIEVDKGLLKHSFYTGFITETDTHIKINTIKNEVLWFRKEQIVQRELIRDDKNGRR